MPNKVKLLSDVEFEDRIRTIDVTELVPPCNAFTLLYFPNINEKDMTGMIHINAQDFVECIGFVNNLQFVTLDHCTQFSAYQFMAIFDTLSECRWISLLRCQSLESTPAYCIMSSCPKLKFMEFKVSNEWSRTRDWRRVATIFYKVRFGRKVEFP